MIPDKVYSMILMIPFEAPSLGGRIYRDPAVTSRLSGSKPGKEATSKCNSGIPEHYNLESNRIKHAPGLIRPLRKDKRTLHLNALRREFKSTSI